MSLTTEQRECFARDGFVSYGLLLEPEEIPPLREEYDRAFAEEEQAGGLRNLSSDSEHPQMLQLMQVCERSLLFRRLLYDERILDAVEALIGPNIMLFHDQALFKPARTGGPIFWHQDNAYWRCSPPNLISCWLTLDDAVRENGAMQLLPGSHFRIQEHERSAEGSPLLRAETGRAAVEPVVVELPAGGCMFHHCQALHCTAPNETERPRRAFAMHFMAPGTRDAKGEVMQVGWGRPMLRNR
jgi:ectoine hydroxylase-related dioxygenase (phytanoyl-CoA dioxygenase family)